ncbi:MAG: phosphatidate cytidylyltransferase [Bacillota bacterium]
MLRQRIITAIMGIPIVVALLYIASIPLFFAVLLMFFLGGRELIDIGNRAGLPMLELAVYTGGVLLITEAFFFQGTYASFFLFLAFMVLVLQWLFFNKNYHFSSLGVSFLGVIYLSFLKYILLLRELPNGFMYVIIALLLTWIVDTGAYFSGRRFGKRKLAPAISPNKTQEGALGGLLTAVIAMLGIDYFIVSIGIMNSIILASSVALVGQVGDLFESLLKRKAGIKDSGQLLPGHGGMLDRLDSVLLTFPAFFYLIKKML